MKGMRLGKVSYYGYSTVAEAFEDLDPTSQAIYALLVAKRRPEGEAPILVLDIPAIAEAVDATTQEVYVHLAQIASVVIMEDIGSGLIGYAPLIASLSEVVDSETSELAATTVVVTRFGGVEEEVANG